jgi:hypothetical protein
MILFGGLQNAAASIDALSVRHSNTKASQLVQIQTSTLKISEPRTTGMGIYSESIDSGAGRGGEGICSESIDSGGKREGRGGGEGRRDGGGEGGR